MSEILRKPLKMKQVLFTLILILAKVTTMSASIEIIQVYSDSMKKDVPCVVITPTNYDVQDSTKRYPSVYMLHGYSGDHLGFRNFIPDIQALVDFYQLIVICPDGGYNSWYVDSPTSRKVKYETFTAKELVTYVDKNYKTINDLKYRAIMGLSMGGHGALYLSIRHPETYGAACSMSGGVDFRPFPTEWELKDRFGSLLFHRKDWDKYVVTEMVDSIPKNLHFMFDCGLDDFFFPVNRTFHEKLLKAGVKHDYIERPGGHDWTYWSNAMRYHLLFIHEFFDKNKGIKKVNLNE